MDKIIVSLKKERINKTNDYNLLITVMSLDGKFKSEIVEKITYIQNKHYLSGFKHCVPKVIKSIDKLTVEVMKQANVNYSSFKVEYDNVILDFHFLLNYSTLLNVDIRPNVIINNFDEIKNIMETSKFKNVIKENDLLKFLIKEQIDLLNGINNYEKYLFIERLGKEVFSYILSEVFNLKLDILIDFNNIKNTNFYKLDDIINGNFEVTITSYLSLLEHYEKLEHNASSSKKIIYYSNYKLDTIKEFISAFDELKQQIYL